MKDRFDVAIIGAGFSGSILASILAGQGRSVALIDRQRHPRFAIGESSTPIADALLRRLGERHDQPHLIELSTHGSWKRSHPELACGLKRGFSYYVHESGKEFSDDTTHQKSLLVAASCSDEVSDTHWYRPDVDAFLFEKAIAVGVTDFSGHDLERAFSGRPARLVVRAANDSVDRTVKADWLLDASGSSSVLASLCKRPPRVARLKTRTYSSFAHYRDVMSWRDQLLDAGHSLGDDPFHADHAAQHHLIDDGWIWMLRFDNGITSVGLTSGAPGRSLNWQRYPSLTRIFKQASPVAPEAAPVMTGRLQRLFDPVLDDRCLMLPTAAVTIDPLHSTGIAHALAGIERVAELVLHGSSDRPRNALADYRQALLDEAFLLDRLVSTAYATMHDFPRFVAACMFYFAAAIRCEERYARGEEPSRLWNADDKDFVAAARTGCDLLVGSEPTERVIPGIGELLRPWNSAGLLDPAVKNRYAYTATKVANPDPE